MPKPFPKSDQREFAYEDELVAYPATIIKARPNDRRGVSKPRTAEEQAEHEKYGDYELEIRRSGGHGIEITLTKNRRDLVGTRKTDGRGIIADCLVTTISFAELCNRIFDGRAFEYREEEHFPAKVREVMKTAYDEPS